MNYSRRRFVLTMVAGLLTGIGTNARADDFTNARMAAGIDAYQSRRFAEASDQFRIACFGLLDQPVVLSEGLARLTLAQEAAGARADVEATLARFLAVERRFGTYAKSRLDAPTRAEFERILLVRVSADTIAGVPSLAGLSGKAAPAAETRKEP